MSSPLPEEVPPDVPSPSPATGLSPAVPDAVGDAPSPDVPVETSTAAGASDEATPASTPLDTASQETSPPEQSSPHTPGSAPDAPAPTEASPTPTPRRADDLSPAACAAKLAELFPALFAASNDAPVKPIKLRIHADILARAPGVFSKRTLGIFFSRYTTTTPYLKALANAPHRFDLDGQPAGEIADEHRQAAGEEVERRRVIAIERRAAFRRQGSPGAPGGHRARGGPHGHDGHGKAAATADADAEPADLLATAAASGDSAAGDAAVDAAAPRAAGAHGRPHDATRGQHDRAGSGTPGPRHGSREGSPRPDRAAQSDTRGAPFDRARGGPGAGRHGGGPPRGGDPGPRRHAPRDPQGAARREPPPGQPHGPRPPSRPDARRDDARDTWSRHARDGAPNRPGGHHGAPHDRRAHEHFDHDEPRTALPSDPAQRERALLLRAFETSTLSKANFCALKRMSEADLDAALAQARQERGPAAAANTRSRPA
jgi:sRNA-binding protein